MNTEFDMIEKYTDSITIKEIVDVPYAIENTISDEARQEITDKEGEEEEEIERLRRNMRLPSVIDAITTVENEKFILEKPGKQFRWYNKRAMFTYKSHLCKEDLEIFFKELRDPLNEKVTWFRAAHENGDELNPYEHTHAVVVWNKSWQSTSSRKFDFMGIHPHIRKITSAQHLHEAKRYLGKEDQENYDLIEDDVSRSIDAICQMTSDEIIRRYGVKNGKLDTMAILNAEAIKQAVAPRKANRVLKELKYTWQKQFLEFSKMDQTSRKICWFYDYIGATGKTDILHHFLDRDDHETIWITVGKTNDLAFLIGDAWASRQWTGSTVILNIPREMKDYSGAIYTTIEALKDELIFSPKYKSAAFRLDSGLKLFIFANFPPENERVSHDRWDIWYIDSLQEDIRMWPVSIGQIHGIHNNFLCHSQFYWGKMRDSIRGAHPDCIHPYRKKILEEGKRIGYYDKNGISNYPDELPTEDENTPVWY